MDILDFLKDNRSLTARINKLKPPVPFILDLFFPTVESHDSEIIDIEIQNGSSSIATFSHTDERVPRAVKGLSKTIKSVKIPRTFESKLFTIQKLRDLTALGNNPYMSAKERESAQKEGVNYELADLLNRVLRLREKLACEAISTGKISVSQENLAFEVDYGFKTTGTDANKITLAAAKKWSADGTKPMADMRAWKRQIARISGFNATDFVLGTQAADAFLSNADVLKKLDNNNNKVGYLDTTATIAPGATYLGKIDGINIWEYSQQYVVGGTSYEMIDPTLAIMGAKDAPFKLHRGPIYRIENGVAVPVSYDYYLQSKADDYDTSIEWIGEQKSLPTIHDPGAIVSAVVV